MKTYAVAAVITLLMLNGCHTSETAKVTVLKSFLKQDDHLVVQTFLSDNFLHQEPPAKDEVKDGVSSTWTPGFIELEPISAVEPTEPSKKQKGVHVTIRETYYTITGRYGQPEEGKHGEDDCFLDQDELEDLSSAIGYFQQKAAEWNKGMPALYTQLHFRTKDGLVLKMFPLKGKPNFVAEINDKSEAINVNELGALKSELDKEINALKAF